MFEGLKNMAGIAGIMKDMPRMRQKLEEVKENLARIELSAETGGGAVKATVNCRMRVVSVRVDPAMMAGLIDPSAPQDRALAEELIAGAVNAALEKAQERAAQEFQTAARDLGLPLPPGGLTGMM
jgi:DNA-binding YbaB/EbfC family protein